MHQVDIHNGRVLAVRAGIIEQASEVEQVWKAMAAALKQARGKVVATADFRIGALYSPAISDGLLGLLRKDNPMVERSAHLVGASATFGMQIERLVRESGHESRKVFRSVDQALAFLSEVLTPGELQWLRSWYETPPQA